MQLKQKFGEEKVEEQIALEEEQKRKALKEEEGKKQQEEDERKALEEEQKRNALEEEQRRKTLEEEQRRKVLEEEQRRKALEEEQRKKVLEEEERKAFKEELQLTDGHRQFLLTKLQQLFENQKIISQDAQLYKEADIVIYFLRKIRKPSGIADLRRLQKDIDTDSVKMPKIVDKYIHEPRYDNAITALIEYSLREEAISKAAEDASFENIISILASFKQDQSVDQIVDPFSHLLEQAKEGQKLKKEDITQLQSLSRTHLLNTAIFNDQHNPINISEVLQLLLRGDQYVINMLQNSSNI
ncbi:MAG: hypothetical protein EZS28_048267, partial [Streblomastix strix]